MRECLTIKSSVIIAIIKLTWPKIFSFVAILSACRPEQETEMNPLVNRLSGCISYLSARNKQN